MLTQEDKDIIESMIPDAEIVLRIARRNLIKEFPFYGKVAMMMPLIPEYNWLPTAATDGRCLYYNPEFILGMSDERKASILKRVPDEVAPQVKEYLESRNKLTLKCVEFLVLHEVKHSIRQHVGRTGSRDKQLAYIAADHAINTTQLKEFKCNSKEQAIKEMPIVEMGCCDMKYDGWSFEDIYEDLIQEQDTQKSSEMDMHVNPDGSVSISEEEAELLKQIGIDVKEAPHISEEKRKDIEIHSKMSIEAAAKSTDHGDIPDEMKKILDNLHDPVINYVDILTAKLTSLVKSHQTYNKVNRRSVPLTNTLRRIGRISRGSSVVMPSYDQEKQIDVNIYVDTSGSVWSYLHDLLSEIVGVTKQFSAFNINLACFDTKIHNKKTFTHNDSEGVASYECQGGGGTVANCIFEDLDSLDTPASQVLILSDMYFSDISQWESKYGNITTWVVFDNNSPDIPFGDWVKYEKYKD